MYKKFTNLFELMQISPLLICRFSRCLTGPGPGAYMLPSSFGYNNNEPTGRRSPGYSFGLRGPDDIKKAGPGPGAYKTDALTRYGKSRYFNYS